MSTSMDSKDCPIPETIKHWKVWELFFLCGVAFAHLVGRQRPSQSDSVRLERGTGACECLGSLLAKAGKDS